MPSLKKKLVGLNIDLPKKKKKEEEIIEIPAPEPITKPAPVPATTPEVFRSSETGRISGVTIGGKTYMGLSPDEVRQMTEAERLKRETPEGALEVSQAASLRKGEILGEQIGQFTPEQLAQISGAEKTDITNKQAVLSGVAAAIPTALQYGGAGAAAGLIKGGGTPLLMIAGGVGGTALGFYKGYQANLRSQAGGQISASSIVLRDNRRIMQRIVSNTWTSRGDLNDSVVVFNQAKANIFAEYSKLIKETDSNLNLALSQDGTTVLQQYEDFLAPNGMLDYWENEFRIALRSPINVERGIALLNEVDLQEFA